MFSDSLEKDSGESESNFSGWNTRFCDENEHNTPQIKLCFRILLWTVFFIFTGISAVSAQNKIRGIITDIENVPLSGATITNTESHFAILSNAGGAFDINARIGDVLIISFVGYQARQITITNDSTVRVILKISSSNLEQVIVTGYISQKAKEITGSIATVTPKDLLAVPAGQPEQMLQGRVAGLNVITQALPGSSTLVSLHGYGNFGNVTPLYIIDGTPGNINDLNPYDIESLQVLKDAGAASIYGVRGANGVILISTKKGKSGKMNISYENYFGWQEPLQKGYDLLNPQEMADVTWNAYKNSGQPLIHPQYSNNPSSLEPILPDYILAGTRGGLFEGDPAVDPAKYNNDPNAGPIYQIARANKSGTDWLHAFYQPAFSQSHTISASGGSDKNSYLLSLGYLDQEGTLLETYLKKLTLRINTEFYAKNNIKVGENLQISYKQVPDYDAPGNPDPRFSGGLSISNPIIPISDIEGNEIGGAPGLGGALGRSQLENNKYNKRTDLTIFGNVFADISFAKYFNFKTVLGGNLNNYYYYFFQPGLNTSNSLTEGSGFTRSWTWQNTVVFNKIFSNVHSVKALVGTEFINSDGRNLFGSRVNFFTNDPNYRFLSNGAAGINNGSVGVSSALYSIFGFLSYGYKEKYLFSATLRRDGSSVFGSLNRYGSFPSLSAAWRLSKEYFARNLTWLTDMKLRVSWGKLGFDGNTNPYNQFTLYGGDAGSSFYDITASNTNVAQGFRAISIGNGRTGWQTDINSNIGMDATLWNGIISFSADWYIKRSTGLLFPLALPDLLGGATPPNVNVGEIKNTGFDLLLNSTGYLFNHFKYEIGATFTSYKNIITKLNEGLNYFDIHNSRNQVGHPISSYYGYKIIGFFNSDEDISKFPAQESAAPGRFKYLNANGDSKIDDKDRVFIGNPNPKFTLGLNIGFSYKNFDFSTFFYTVYGNEVMNYIRNGIDFFPGLTAKSKTLLYNSWTPAHHDAKVAINETFSNFSNNGVFNSYVMEDGSYIRNKSMILGYTLPRAILQKMKINLLRIYVQVVNLFTITRYTGLDPEAGAAATASSFGFDLGNYPNNQKQLLVGLNLNF